MNLIIFDLDETLINVDSDVEWGRYLIEKIWLILMNGNQNEKFYWQYKNGQLDINEYLYSPASP